MKKILSAALALVCIWFATPARAALPSGYTQLEYIESTGTQWINTGIIPTQSFKAQIDFATNNLGAFYILQSRSSTAATIYGVSGSGTNATLLVNYSSGEAVAAPFTRTGTEQQFYIDFEAKNGMLVANFTNKTTGETSTQTGTYDYIAPTANMGLFGNTAGQRTTAKVYDVMMYQNDALVRNFIPAKRNSDNVLGMYDTVTNTFFTNAGTGEFVAGAPVTTCDGTVVNYVSATGTGVQNGTPTPDNPIYPTFYKQGDMVLRKVGDYADTYDASTGKITRRVGEYIFTGRESIDTQYNVYGVTTIPYDMDKVTNASLCSHNKTYVNNLVTGIDRTFDKFLFFTNVNKVGFGLSDTPPEITNTETFKQWLAAQYANGTPVTIYYPLAEETTEDWPASQCTTDPIKIATTKYNETKFSPLNTALQNAISVVDTVVTQTITQAASIATLQTQKQTRPADDPSDANNAENCPAGKKCLLVEDASGIPHWYEIVENAWDLPAGYTQLEYIESTGTQYIDTGVMLGRDHINTDIKLEYDALIKQNSTSWQVCGTLGDSGIYIGVNGSNIIYYGAGILDTSTGVRNPFVKCKYINDGKNGIVKVTNLLTNIDIVNLTYTPITKETILPMILFGFSTNETTISSFKMSADMYNAKIYDKDILIRNFIPAKRNSDNVIGMYDTVNNRFYTNAGTGEFIAGPVAE